MSNESNAAARAVACTATGVLSSFPKWEWLPGMLSVETTPAHLLRRQRVLWVEKLVDHGGERVPFIQLEKDGWIRLATFAVFAALPDFSDPLTLHGLHALVIRAWAGHEVRLMTNVVDGRCMRHSIFVIAPDGKTRAHANGGNDLALLLVEALEAAPCSSTS